VTPLVKRLEAKKFVSKVRAKDDERVVVISLTKVGRALKRKAKDIPYGLLCRLGSKVETLTQLRDELNPPKELGSSGNGANPEQLFAAGYGACFESAVRYVARRFEIGRPPL